MRIIIETENIGEIEQLVKLLKMLKIDSFSVEGLNEEVQAPVITKGNKNIGPSDLFGIWKENPRTVEDLRKDAWNRDWN